MKPWHPFLVGFAMSLFAGCGSDRPAEAGEDPYRWPEPGAGWDKVLFCSPDAQVDAPDQCGDTGDACCCGTECCSGLCSEGACAPGCGGLHAPCTPETAKEDCCSGECTFLGCSPAANGQLCVTHDDCLGGFCHPDFSRCDTFVLNEPRIEPAPRPLCETRAGADADGE
jgi:hypothetical protein